MRIICRALALLILPLAIVSPLVWHPVTPAVAADELDILIVHGKVVDGSGRKVRRADVGIRGDRIVFVGDATKQHIAAKRTIDAAGTIFAPRPFEPHTPTPGG